VVDVRGKGLLLIVGLMVGLLVSELDATMFATAMPTIVGDLDGLSLMPWVTTAYVVAATVVMPVYGRLGDIVGRRRMLVTALSVFLAGSVVGGLSAAMPQLIVARVVQGLGAVVCSSSSRPSSPSSCRLGVARPT
jgi:MFS family permease